MSKPVIAIHGDAATPIGDPNAIDREGNVALPFNNADMYRDFGYVGDAPSVGIYR